MQSTSIAVLLALVSTLFFGASFVLTQFALRFMPPWLGAAFSVPTSTVLFWCLAPFTIDTAHASFAAITLFAGVGLLFPASVTLLNFESNRFLGPNIASAVSGLAPVFAVLLALVVLGETLRIPQACAIAAIAGGVMLMYWGERKDSPPWSLWMFALPLGGAAVRGLIQPIIKFGLQWWSSPVAAVVIGYTMSSLVLISAARIRGEFRREVDRRGVVWFAAVGICNGLAVLVLYAALGYGPVGLVAPLVASYPLITLLLSLALLRQERVSPQLIAGIAVTVGGVVVLLLS